MNWHELSEWAAGAVLTTVSYLTRLVFGKDHLSKWELIMFYVFCGGVLWITNTFLQPGIIRSSIQLGSGLVIPNLITGIIGGAKKSEATVSKTVEKAVDNLADKVGDVADALTKKNDDKK